MLSFRACKMLISAVGFAVMLAVVPASATRTHRGATSGHTKKAKKKSASSGKIHGQRQIDPERTKEIQAALIHEHYLTGEPSGEWDSQSQAAMSRFQSDQGWQSKITPDSRALIKLGLGPNPDPGKVPAMANEATSVPNANGAAAHAVPAANSLVGPQSANQ